jgi:CMP-N,N'-diacetyllegionaminic acid synthase
MSRLAIIPVRSGSKGLPDKNILPLLGKPLVAYTIECALASGAFDKVFVSTDSEKYAAIATEYGADASFLRSAETSGDTAGSWDVVREVLEHFEKNGEHYDEIMLLQATSPLRIPEDIQAAIRVMDEKKAQSVVSVCKMEHSPVQCDVIPEDGCMNHFAENEYADLPRQMIPTYYRLNGAIFLITREELDRTPMFRTDAYSYEMPAERSVDIDERIDFDIAEIYMRNRS